VNVFVFLLFFFVFFLFCFYHGSEIDKFISYTQAIYFKVSGFYIDELNNQSTSQTHMHTLALFFVVFPLVVPGKFTLNLETLVFT